MDKYQTLSKKIINYLKDRKAYDGVDVTLIDELVFNLELCDKAKEDIRIRGIQVDIGKGDREYMQVNQSVTIYNSALKMITAISTKLGLTVLDRTKLKLKEKAKETALESLLND